MGFNKKYLGTIDDLKKTRKTFTSDIEFLRCVIGKCDSLVGPSESVDYINSIYLKIKGKSESNSIG
jgi:hypothetical protein